MEQVSVGAAGTAREAEQDRSEQDGPQPGLEVAAAEQGLVRRGRAAVVHRGMVSAEWAVGIVAAIAIAGVLLGIVTSDEVSQKLLAVILKVINTFTEFVK